MKQNTFNRIKSIVISLGVISAFICFKLYSDKISADTIRGLIYFFLWLIIVSVVIYVFYLDCKEK